MLAIDQPLDEMSTTISDDMQSTEMVVEASKDICTTIDATEVVLDIIQNDTSDNLPSIDTISVLDAPILTEGGDSFTTTQKDHIDSRCEAGHEDTNVVEEPHMTIEVNIVVFSELPVLTEGGERVLPIRDDCAKDRIQARSENTDKNDECDLDVSDSGSIWIHALDDLLELPDAADKPRAYQTVEQDTKPTNDNDDLTGMDSGCIVSLSDGDQEKENVHPMQRSEPLPGNLVSQLLLSETKKISELPDTSNTFSTARQDCESVCYDVTEALAIPLDDPHHDWGIAQSFVVDRQRPTFG